MPQELALAISECEHDRLFILTDDTTERLCRPVVSRYLCLKGAQVITIAAGDAHKDLDALSAVWMALQQGGATRHSCLINLGGGMVTDLGGLAASTFKRGIDFINIPTTLLAMVDASVGGKTGINFNGLKNEIGVFREAACVIINTQFLKTLDDENLRSGYAEMLKHGLISSREMLSALLRFPIEGAMEGDALRELQQMVAESVAVKQRIVLQDPHEHGLRKALNLGHTVGHAIESLALRRGRPLLHGYAVAHGLVAELYLSHACCGFPQTLLSQTAAFVRRVYGQVPITCDDYPELLDLMTHDKKNTAGAINFTLLADAGQLCLNRTASLELIAEALDFCREGG